MDEIKQEELLKKIINTDDIKSISIELNKLHPAEISDIIEQLPDVRRKNIWDVVDLKKKGEIFLEVHGDVKNDLINLTSEQELIETVADLQLDEIADLDADLPSKVVDALIQQMDTQKRQGYESIKEYPDNTAGGLMDLDAVTVRSDITVGVALRYIKFLRSKYENLPEHLDSVYVVDIANNFIGAVSLVDLLSMPADALIIKIVNRAADTVTDTTFAHKVAKLFEDHDLISVAVVDAQKKLLGRITVDDIVDVIREEGEKLTMRPAGLTEKTDMFGSIYKTIKYRALWHGVNLINAFIAAFTISLFSDSIDKIVSLAILMPVIASMGGVAGNQTLTLVTRGLALEQITKDNKKLLFNRELLIGFSNGTIWAVVVAIITYVWMQNYTLSMVFAVSMLLGLLLSSIAGTVIPLVLKKLGIDPALAGSVILVAISDVAGFFIFLSIATLFLLG